jgi:hypothetical protein
MAGARRVAGRFEGVHMMGIFLKSAKVTSINSYGFWIKCGDEELYLPFVEFPCFQHATVPQICKVKYVSATRIYWPELDIDYALEALRNPLTSPNSTFHYDC